MHTDTSCKPTSTEADHYAQRHKLQTNKYRGGPLHTQTQAENQQVQRRTITHTDTSCKPTSTEADIFRLHTGHSHLNHTELGPSKLCPCIPAA